MTDSFADLWNSTAPSTTKPAPAPQKLGQALSSAATQNVRKPTNDIFSMLAAPSSSNPATRSATPLYTNINTSQSARASPILSSAAHGRGTQTPVQKTNSSNGSGDAFSGLLSGSFSSSANQANLTIAQRAALAERQKTEKLLGTQGDVSVQSHDAWAGLDTLAATSASLGASASATPPSIQKQQDDWDFGFGAAPIASALAPAVSQSASHQDVDDWGLGEFTTKPSTTQPPSASQKPPEPPKDIWDFDDFSSAPSQPPNSSSRSEPSLRRSSSPGDFDFGEREGGLLDGQSDDEDNILGDLTKPVEQVRAASTTPAAHLQTSGSNSRSVSPPPHILGQIVEMGFSIQQARVALAATETGLDVQAALETLLSNGAAGGSDTPPSPHEDPRERIHTRPSPARQPDRPRRGEEPPRRRATRDREHETPSPGLEGITQKNLQEHADKFIAQASEIGLSMFSRANAFWKEGKEKVQKAYEERAAAAVRGGSSRSGGQTRDGRPKWMQDAEDQLHGEDGWKSPDERSGFRDHEDGEDQVLPPRPRVAPAPTPRREPDSSSSSRSQTGDLLGGDSAPAVYRSPFRNKSSSRSQTPASSSAATPKSTPAPQSARAPSPITLIQRKTVSASPSALSTSTKHKDAGTDSFKLGQYAEAEKAYSNAIAALPSSHLLLIPLYNNRALTRLKTGDHSGAIEDTTLVLNLIGPSYHPSREAKVTKQDEGATVDIADGYVKALRRRAEAYEGKEKWDQAQKDWEAIAAAEWANGKLRSEAVTMSGRCRKMLAVDLDSSSSSSSKPKPSAAPTKPQARSPPVPRAPPPKVNINPQNSEALKRVREANQAAEAEDEAKHQFKDVVDAKLAAWKTGKETNIRALIASLETVLWPELGWQKVGMHELVTPNQVKIRYTKAIAKLHPDKLSAMKLTVEQRMIANGVFGALNEAWNAFKP